MPRFLARRSTSLVLRPVMMALGFVIAWHFYIRRPDLPAAVARNQAPLYRFLLNKWYFDELYDLIFVRQARVTKTSSMRIGRVQKYKTTRASVMKTVNTTKTISAMVTVKRKTANNRTGM